MTMSFLAKVVLPPPDSASPVLPEAQYSYHALLAGSSLAMYQCYPA
jgi:hypothetical protein